MYTPTIVFALTLALFTRVDAGTLYPTDPFCGPPCPEPFGYLSAACPPPPSLPTFLPPFPAPCSPPCPLPPSNRSPAPSKLMSVSFAPLPPCPATVCSPCAPARQPCQPFLPPCPCPSPAPCYPPPNFIPVSFAPLSIATNCGPPPCVAAGKCNC